MLSPRYRFGTQFRRTRRGLSGLVVLLAVVSCGPKEADITFLLRDQKDDQPAADVEVRLAGQDRLLGSSDVHGRVHVNVPIRTGGPLRFRLSEQEKPGRRRHHFEEIYEVDPSAMRGGVKTIWLATEAEAAADTSERVTLVVTSDPSGGEVFLDSTRVGVAPATVNAIHAGRHLLEVRLSGYQPYALDIVLDPGERSLHAALQRNEEARAALRVTSDPPGARVRLDGGNEVGVTPTQLSDLRPGAHTVQLELAGYGPFETEVNLKAGGLPGSVGAVLRPSAPSPGASPAPEKIETPNATHPGRGTHEYLVGTTPGWAEVYVNGETASRNVTGRFKVTLPAGRNTFRLVNARAGVELTLSYDVKAGDPNSKLLLDYANGRIEARP